MKTFDGNWAGNEFLMEWIKIAKLEIMVRRGVANDSFEAGFIWKLFNILIPTGITNERSKKFKF